MTGSNKPNFIELYPDFIASEDYDILCRIATHLAEQCPKFTVNLPHGIYLTNEPMVEILDTGGKPSNQL